LDFAAKSNIPILEETHDKFFNLETKVQVLSSDHRNYSLYLKIRFNDEKIRMHTKTKSQTNKIAMRVFGRTQDTRVLRAGFMKNGRLHN